MYSYIYAAGQWVRKRNYKLFRRIVEHPWVVFSIQALFGSKLVEARTPEGDLLAINPIYHGNFLNEESIRAYEPEMRHLFKTVLGDGMVLYDVGANVGVFSLYSLHLVGDSGGVHAFEPEPNNIRCLQRTQKLSDSRNFQVHPVGVGSKSETMFFDRRGGAMSGRLVDESSETNRNVNQMQVVSVDDFIYTEGHRPPNVVKIDVEGNEIRVIEGMRRTLEEHAPIIICELHHSLEPNVVGIYDVLDSYGYKSYDINDWTTGAPETPLESYNGVHHVIATCTPTVSG